MADVTDRNRAQMLLVGALSLATIFILLSLLLNSAIYTENLATRRTNVGAEDAASFRVDAQTGVDDAIEYVNRNGDRSYTTRYADYRTNLVEWRRIRANFSVSDGQYTNVTPESGYEGTRIVDDNASTEMTPRDGSSDWTVASDVKSRRFVIDVNGSAGLPTETPANVANYLGSGTTGVFRVVFDDGSRTAVAIYRNSSSSQPELLVYEYPTGEYDTCAVPSGRVQVFRRLADGKYCDPLSAVSPSGAHDVDIVDGDRLTGTYSLVVDRLETPLRNSSNTATYGDQCTAAFAADNTSTPYTTPAVYSTTVRLEVVSAESAYFTTERAAPAERGNRPVDPRFRSLNVSENNPRNFTVSWDVSDPNEDLSEVRAELVAGGNVTTSVNTAVGGGTASGIFSLNSTESGPYHVVTTVVDGAGNQRQINETHATDGDNSGCPP